MNVGLSQFSAPQVRFGEQETTIDNVKGGQWFHFYGYPDELYHVKDGAGSPTKSGGVLVPELDAKVVLNPVASAFPGHAVTTLTNEEALVKVGKVLNLSV